MFENFKSITSCIQFSRKCKAEIQVYFNRLNVSIFLYYVRTWGWVGGPENDNFPLLLGGPENDNFPLLYVVKMSLRRWMGGSKRPQNTLT